MSGLRERLARTPPGYRFSIGRVLAIYSGLMVALLLAALDQTIVATALPRVVSELGGISQYSWVFTAYVLGSTVTVPLYGRLGDVYGRKPLFIVAITVFLVGSTLCGLAQNMVQLVVFRAIQGVGAGGLFPLTLAMVGMIVPPRDRGRYQGLIGSVFAAASIVGPLVGGFIVDNTSWRWIFFVNLPVGVVALAVILVTMPRRAARQEHSIDWLGAAILAAGTTSLLLGLVWGGREYAWGSAMVISLFGVAVASLAGFLLVQRRVRDPILPLGLFGNRTFTTANSASFVYSMAFMGTTSFLPLFMQVGQGVPATKSGLTMLALMVGMIASSTLSGQLVTRTGKFKPFMMAGGVALLAGVGSLCFIGPDTSTLDLAARLLLVGIGLGPGQSLFNVAVQNSVPFHQLGVATSSGQFVRQIGSTMGVALFGALLTAGLSSELARHAPTEPGAVVHHLDLADLQKMALQRSLHPEAAQAALADPAVQAENRVVRESFSVAIVHGMIFSFIVLVVGFILMLMIPAVHLRDRPDGPPAAEASSEPDEGAALAAEHAGEKLRL